MNPGGLWEKEAFADVQHVDDLRKSMDQFDVLTQFMSLHATRAAYIHVGFVFCGYDLPIRNMAIAQSPVLSAYSRG